MAIAKKASIENCKLKVLIWSSPGCGKTRWALNSPSPLVIDTEKSTEVYSNEFDFYRAVVDPSEKTCNNFINLTKSVVDEINANVYEDVETLVIDSISDVLDKVESSAASQYGKKITDLNAVEKTKWYAYRKDNFRKCIDTIFSVDKHVIMTARSKLLWNTVNGKMQPVGNQLDAHEILEYLADIVIKINDDKTIEITKTRLCKEDGVIEGLKTFNDLIEFIKTKESKSKIGVKAVPKGEKK